MIPIIDGHNDLAWAAREGLAYDPAPLAASVPGLHTDLPRLTAGGVGGQFWSVWVDPALGGAEQVTATLEQIDFVQRMIEAHPDRLVAARTADDVRAAFAGGRIASLMGAEGGAQLGGSPAVLRQYARLGVRYLTLTWSFTTSWADSATDAPRHGGLTDFGREVVREMNRIGVLVDLAHVAPSTMRDALEVSTRPVLVTHSGAAALCDHPRNVPDDVLAAIGAADGVVMVAFVPSFLSQARRDWVLAGETGTPPEVGIADVADHIDHVRRVAGVHAVGLGADYDGTDAMPTGLGDVSRYPDLLAELRRRGWTEDELEGLAHRNVLRVLEASDPDYRAFLAGTAQPPAAAALRPAIDPATGRARVLVVVNSDASGPRRLADWLRSEGIEPHVVRGADGLPADLSGYRGLVLLGGGLMPDDDERAPWLAQERVLATQAIAADLPTLGICLGGQLLAHVAGGQVRAAFGPEERGSTAITTTADGHDDAVLRTFEGGAPMIQNHQDMITVLPPGATLLASSEAVANQAFRLGNHVRGLQFHPEASVADVARWSEDVHGTEGLRALIDAAERDHDHNTRVSRALVGAFAAEVEAAAEWTAS